MIADHNIAGRTPGKVEVTRSFDANIVLEAFGKDLPPADIEKVNEAVRGIVSIQRQPGTNVLAIGEYLSKLRNELQPESFCRFMTKVLPVLGISRSTAYRWLGHADKLNVLFPDPAIRHVLMELTDGRGIVGQDQRHGKPRSSRIKLTPAAERAIRSMGPPPNNPEDHTARERWVRQFIKETGKARSCVRSQAASLTKERDALIAHFNRFASRYGLSLAEELCGSLDKIVNERTERVETREFSARAKVPNGVRPIPLRTGHNSSHLD